MCLKSSSRFLSVVFAAALVAIVPLACTSPDDDSSGGGDSGGVDLPTVADTALEGIFIKIEGKSHALGSANVYRFSPTNQREINTSYSGSSSTFHGTKLNYASVTVSNTMTSDSVQTCGTLNTNAKIKLEFGSTSDGWGDAYEATACQIKLDYMSQKGGIQGTIVSATLKNAANKTITISNGKFRVFHYSGYTGLAPEVTSTSTFRATLQIDSGSYELAGGQHFRLSKDIVVGSGIGFGTTTSDGNVQATGNASDAVTLRAASVPSDPGSWLCNQTFSGGKTNISVYVGTYLSEMAYEGIPAAGSGSNAACSLKVVGQRNGARMVTYSGTLVASDNILPLALRRIKVRGAYRNYSLGKQLSQANEVTAGADSQEVLVTIDSSAWHFPKGAKYRASKSFASKVSGLLAYNAGFVHGGSNKDFTINLAAVPSAVGTYTCGALVAGTNPSLYRTYLKMSSTDTSGYIGIDYAAYTPSETPGASCSITVTASADTSFITGTYTARLIAFGAGKLLPDGDTTLSISGSFRTKKQ